MSVHPQRDCCYFYGALNLGNGREIAVPAHEETVLTIANFVRQLLMLCPQPILPLLERAKWHYGDLRRLIEETANA